MALSTYDELLTALANLLNRDDLTDNLPDFVRLCETDIDAREDLALHRRRVCRAEAPVSGEYTRLPSNFLAIQSANLASPLVQLRQASPDQLVALKQDEEALRSIVASTYGVDLNVSPPLYYAVVGSELRLLPVPQTTYTVQMAVYEALPALETNVTNWVLKHFPSIYLYGAALHSAPFLRDDERIETWTSLYERACDRAAKSEPKKTNNVPLNTGLVGLVGRQFSSFR
jgi:hypothetical protein